MKELFSALARAQKQMKNPLLDGVNPHFKSQYATLGACLDAIREPLASNGLALVQMPQILEGRFVLTTKILHESGEELSFDYPLNIHEASTPQQVGSAITYARRYSMCAAMAIVGDEDEDGEESSRKTPEKRPAPPRPVKTMIDLEKAITSTKSLDELQALFNDVKKNLLNYSGASVDELIMLKDRQEEILANQFREEILKLDATSQALIGAILIDFKGSSVSAFDKILNDSIMAGELASRGSLDLVRRMRRDAEGGAK